jgi:hypothetical protein
MAKRNAQVVQQPATQAPATNVTANTAAPINNGLTALVQQAVNNVTATPAAHVKQPAVAVTNGQFTNAAGVTVAVVNATGATGNIAHTNPALRGAATNGQTRKYAANQLVKLGAKQLPLSSNNPLTGIYNSAIAALFNAGTPVTFGMVAAVSNNSHASYVLKGNWLTLA